MKNVLRLKKSGQQFRVISALVGNALGPTSQRFLAQVYLESQLGPPYRKRGVTTAITCELDQARLVSGSNAYLNQTR